MGNILITSAGRRVSLVKFFKTELLKLFPSSQVFVADLKPELSAAAQIADKAFEICEIKNKEYISSLLKICNENQVKLIIPTIDHELLKLSSNLELFKQNNIELVISDEKFISLCESKTASSKLFNEISIKTPKIYSKDNYTFPLFIKPDNGSNSINNYIVKDKSQLCDYFLESDELVFFEYIDRKYFDEFTCDIYLDRSSIVKCIIPRKRFELRGGEVSKSITVRNKLIELFQNNPQIFQGARGCINIQVFVNNKTQEMIGVEINSRFGGGFPLSYLAGGNYPKWIIEEYLLNKPIDYFNDWEENLLMLRYDEAVLVHNYEK